MPNIAYVKILSVKFILHNYVSSESVKQILNFDVTVVSQKCHHIYKKKC